MLIEGFIWVAPTTNAALAYWSDPSTPLQVSSRGIYIVNSLVGDCVLVWRLYMVWRKDLVICVIPAIFVIGSAVSGFGATFEQSRTGQLATIKTRNWFLSYLSLSIATEALVTLAIAGRIYWVSCRAFILSQSASKKSMSVFWVVIESGAIYSLTTLCMLVLVAKKLHVSNVIGSCLAQICAIVPTLIIVRVGIGESFSSQNRTQSSDPALQLERIPVHIKISQHLSKSASGPSSYDD